MKDRRLKQFIALAALGLLGLFGNTAFAQMDPNYKPFQSWDNNNDERLSAEEYMKGIVETDLFQRWDEDESGYLSKNELQTGIYRKWERSGENFKTEAQARAHAWARYYTGNFDDWDLNGDGTITNAEYNKKIGNEKTFALAERMDNNNNYQIEKTELYSTMFKMWDEDNSGFLSTEEYDPDEFDSWFL